MLPPGKSRLWIKLRISAEPGRPKTLSAFLDNCQEPREVREVADVTTECIFH
jgi:hypothetical protein